jgi:hypothetical protein
MNWKERKNVCKTQVSADERFGNDPMGGVEVKNSQGKIEYLNTIPKTNWKKQLAIANESFTKKQ